MHDNVIKGGDNMSTKELHHNALDVAKWFFRRNNAEAVLNEADDISNLKLQKLLYYAQGICLAMTGQVLFYDDIVAWKHGPVVVSVYDKYCSYGRQGIPYTDDMKPQEAYTEAEEDILEKVFEYFGQFSAWKLRNMTHEEAPWQNTVKNHVISTALIKDYFERHYVAEEN